MTTPFNPFGGGRGQRGGATGAPPTSNRGRGGAFVPRGSRGFHRGARSRGQRGRGRGRGAGAATFVASDSETSGAGQPGFPPNKSPFASINKQQSASAGFGAQRSQTSSPFQRPASGSGFGSSGSSVASGGSGQEEHANDIEMSSGNWHGIPVEDTSTMARYGQRFEKLKQDRAKERERAIASGQMADPNQPMTLNKAITPVGTCTTMCPAFESVERIVQKMVDKSEKFLHPATQKPQYMETKMIKRFRRSAAGYDEQLPSDIRTPKALLQTTNYLIRYIIGGNEPLANVHKFVWDRTRSIRNDFSVQQLTQEADLRLAVTCLERIARFHIMSLHLLSNPSNEVMFDRHQEREQLSNTMLSLMYYYDDNRGRISFPNEVEFRAYYILLAIQDPLADLESRVQKWPASILQAPSIQIALEMYAAAANTWNFHSTIKSYRQNAIAQGFYTRFFNLVNSPSVSYLMGCVAEVFFNYVRQTAIRSIWKAYCRSPASQQHKNDEWTVRELTKVLHFDNDEQTVQFCKSQNLDFAENVNGELYLNWGNRPVNSIEWSPSSEHAFSETYVESKRAGRSLVAIVLGMTVQQAARMDMIDKSALPERVKAPSTSAVTPEAAEPLFVPADNQMPAPAMEANKPQPPAFTNQPLAGPGAPTTTTQPPSLFQPPAQSPFSMLGAPSTAGGVSGAAASPFSGFTSTSGTGVPPTTGVSAFSGSSGSSLFKPAEPSPQPSTTGLSGSSLFKPAEPTSMPGTTGSSSFSFFKPAEPTSSEQAQPSPSTQNPFAFLDLKPTTAGLSGSLFKPAEPSLKPVTTESSGFSFLKPAKPTQNEEAKPPSETASIFSTSTATGTSTTAPVASSTAAPNPFAASLNAFMSNKTTSPPPAPSISTTKPLFRPSETTEDKEAEIPVSEPSSTSLFSRITEPSPLPSSDILKPSTAEHDEAPLAPANDSESHIPSTSVNPPPLLENIAPTESHDDAEGQLTLSQLEQPPSDTAKLDQSTSAAASPPQESARSSWSHPDDETPEERRAAWLRMLARAQEKYDRKQAKNRKRARDEQAASVSTQEEPSPKAPKVSPPQEPTIPKKRPSDPCEDIPLPDFLKRRPFKSYEDIPMPPILERIKAGLKPPPPTEAELAKMEAAKEKERLKRQRVVDEDEILLSAARLAANELASGPSLVDSLLQSDIWARSNDSRRTSYSPHNSFSRSASYGQSTSPPQWPNHGYEVAYGPDMPPGVPLSRSEMRIRMTGAHGLANVPLNFTPEQKAKMRRQGYVFPEDKEQEQKSEQEPETEKRKVKKVKANAKDPSVKKFSRSG